MFPEEFEEVRTEEVLTEEVPEEPWKGVPGEEREDEDAPPQGSQQSISTAPEVAATKQYSRRRRLLLVVHSAVRNPERRGPACPLPTFHCNTPNEYE